MGMKNRYQWMGTCLALLGFSVPIWADGGFVSRKDMREPEQRAVIFFADGVEDLIIEVVYEGAVDDFAWLVPLPAIPEVTVVEESPFKELRDYVFERSKWSTSAWRRLGAGSRGASVESPVKDGGVTVHERKQVGPYDIAVLSATLVDDLVRWCKKHGYQVTDDVRAVLKSYVDRGWVFTAMRIHPEAQSGEEALALRLGKIQAMRFSFPTVEAIYPLRISSINRGKSDVLLYLLADDALIHPAFKPRHPAPLEEFRVHRLDAAALGTTYDDQTFTEHFDAAHSTYRTVSLEELPRARAALPRWGEKPLYLTALQRTFNREEMDYDVVFKTPEELSDDQQKEYIRRSFGDVPFIPDSLSFRMPDATRDIIYAQLNRGAENAVGGDLFWGSQVRILLSLPNADGRTIMSKTDSKSRKYLPYVLSRAMFATDYSCRPHDQIAEADRCRFPHDKFQARSGASWSCHYRLGTPPAGPAYAFEEEIAVLFLDDGDSELVAKMLSALGTDKAVGLLIRAAMGDLDGLPSAEETVEEMTGFPWGSATLLELSFGHRLNAETSRREVALNALRQVARPEMTAVYTQVFDTQRASLNDRELAYCLSGLWTNGDAAAVPLVRRIEAYCRESNLAQATLMAQNLLVNRFRVRRPHVTRGMKLDALRKEMGGRGALRSQRNRAGEEVPSPRFSLLNSYGDDDIPLYNLIYRNRSRRENRKLRGIERAEKERFRVEVEVYRWDAGEATLKNGVLVEWVEIDGRARS